MSKEPWEKWLKPIKLDREDINGADRRAKDLLYRLKNEAKFWEKVGVRAGHWKEDDEENAKRGCRGEYWVGLMLSELNLTTYHPRLEEWEEKPWDYYVKGLGTIEVKTSPFGENYVDIKKGFWDQHPSIFLLALKTCDKEMETFQFMGWLYGHEVYKLEVIEAYKPYYKAGFNELHRPKKFFDMIIEMRK